MYVSGAAESCKIIGIIKKVLSKVQHSLMGLGVGTERRDDLENKAVLF